MSETIESVPLAPAVTPRERRLPHRVAFVVNNAAFFVSHRLPIALAAQRAGCEVMLFTGQAGSALLEKKAVVILQSAGVAHRAVAFRSGGVNVFRELQGLLQLAAALSRFRPDVVHCASPKGVLYGGIGARLAGSGGVVLAVSGMGYLFTGRARGWKQLLRGAYGLLVRFAYGHVNRRAIVQNRDDLDALRQAGLVGADEVVLIPGSGVRLSDYDRPDPALRQDIVLLPARLLKDKGVVEFAEAARTLSARQTRWRFVLAGTADYENPSAVSQAQIRAWVDEGILEWWGHRDDMAEVFAQARIVCLPSYREGMPKALLEAAAAGCAVVTTDVTGCREAVVPGETGELVPARDAVALADALAVLMADPTRCRRYGEAGARRAREQFSEDAVIERTFAIYQELNERADP